MPVSADVLSTLPSFLRELLDNCPTAGDGLHFWIFKCARHLLAHFNEDAVYQLLRAKAAGRGRPIKKLEREIVSQIRGAWALPLATKGSVRLWTLSSQEQTPGTYCNIQGERN
jgi:hypothetical protein